MPLRSALALLSLLGLRCLAASADEVAPVDPYWNLVHDRAVIEDLKLTSDQGHAWRAVLDPLDLRCFPLRNQSPKEAESQLAKILNEAKAGLANVMKPQQVRRLAQIVVRAQGPAALLRDDLAAKLKLSEKQQTDIRKAVTDARDGRAKLERELRAGKLETAKAEGEHSRLNALERDAVNAVLTNDQKLRLTDLVARDFDVTKLGDTAFKTPDVIGGNHVWVNGQPVFSESLHGRVVVLHFFAFGCSNCIHNYPVYREWQKELAEKEVPFIGIHTPETQSEHNVETLKKKLAAEKLSFPVLVDNDKANWNAFGNSMWPSVYVIDKQGYMRAFWPGELKWQGATGDVQIRNCVERLLKEQQL
jgi:thiol-disulfide isomerase/thioredoxin